MKKAFIGMVFVFVVTGSVFGQSKNVKDEVNEIANTLINFIGKPLPRNVRSVYEVYMSDTQVIIGNIKYPATYIFNVNNSNTVSTANLGITCDTVTRAMLLGLLFANNIDALEGSIKIPANELTFMYKGYFITIGHQENTTMILVGP
jgi:hypothetical protein